MESSSTLPVHLGVVAIEKEAFGLPSTTVANLLHNTARVDISTNQ